MSLSRRTGNFETGRFSSRRRASYREVVAVNRPLKERLAEAGLTQAELADAVNAELRAAGYEGTVSDRTVRNWLAGKSLWPHRRQRAALEAVFGRPIAELGFVPRQIEFLASRAVPSGIQVPRRSFLAASAGAALSAATASPPVGSAAPTAIGTSDVIRLRQQFDGLMVINHRRGGHKALEMAALTGADQALSMQQHSASQRIRQRLYDLAADYTVTAAWSAIDAGAFDRAGQHLGRALYLAGMAIDPAIELRVWNSYAVLAYHRQHYNRAVDAAQVAQATSIARRDSMYGSLAHARTAIGHANNRDRHAALRSLGYARDALEKAPDLKRPSWMAFYGSSELSAMEAGVQLLLGNAVEAEAASHKALTDIPAQFQRNRALATARLALAQLHQHDIDQACATAADVFALLVDSRPIQGRIRSLLGDFYRGLITLAPTASAAHEWGDRYQSEWSQA